MEGGIRHTRHPLLLQFSFLLLKNGFQAEEIVTARAFRGQSGNRRLNQQTEFENVLKGEMMQGISELFRPSTGNEASRTAAAHDQPLQLHRTKSFANRRAAYADTFGESTLRR